MKEALEIAFESLNGKDKRMAAEIAYVLAVKAHRNKEASKSQIWAKECIRIFTEIDPTIETMEDAANKLHIVDGVVLPELIHLAVVKERFQEMEIPF